jgi:hypothetical protein
VAELLTYTAPLTSTLDVVREMAGTYDKADVAKIDKAVKEILDSGLAPVSMERYRMREAVGKLVEFTYNVNTKDALIYKGIADALEMILSGVQQAAKEPVKPSRKRSAHISRDPHRSRP